MKSAISTSLILFLCDQFLSMFSAPKKKRIPVYVTWLEKICSNVYCLKLKKLRDMSNCLFATGECNFTHITEKLGADVNLTFTPWLQLSIFQNLGWIPNKFEELMLLMPDIWKDDLFY